MPLCSRVLMAPKFVFPIKDIESGMLDIHERVPRVWLAEALGDTDIEATPDQDGHVDVMLTMSGRDVVVRGTIDASVRLPCGRCMQPIDVAIRGELALLLVPGKAPVSDDGAGKKGKGKGRKKAKEDDGQVISSEDAEFDTYVGDEVVLDGFVREAVLLEVPIFPLCSETCPGIGAASPGDTGEENTIDPRLAPLLELKNKSRA